MFNISATELLVIAVVALLVLGPDKLPDAMRKLGRATRELKRITSGFEAELRDALSDPVEAPASRLTLPSATGARQRPARQPHGGTRAGDHTRAPGGAAVLGRDRRLRWGGSFGGARSPDRPCTTA